MSWLVLRLVISMHGLSMKKTSSLLMCTGGRYILILSFSVLRILLKLFLLPRVKVNLKLTLYTPCRGSGQHHSMSALLLGEESAVHIE